MDQKRLNSTLIQIYDFSKGNMTHAELLAAIDYEAADALARQGLAACQVVQFASGRYRFRWTATSPITPLGKQHLENLLPK